MSAGIKTEIDLKIDAFAAKLDAANKKLDSFGARAARAGKDGGEAAGSGFLAGVAQFAGGALIADMITSGVSAAFSAMQSLVGNFAGGVRKALDLGGHLVDVREQTGLAADEALVLEQAFVNAGEAADAVQPAIAKMQRALAEGTADDLLSSLGLDPESLREMGSGEQFERIGKAIAGIENDADSTAAAMDVFGKSGAKLKAVFKDGGAMDAARQQLGSQAAILKDNADAFDKISDSLGAGVQAKFQGFFVGAAAKMASSMQPALDKLMALDFSELGGRVGNELSRGINAGVAALEVVDWTKGAGMLKDSLAAAFTTAIAVFNAGINEVFKIASSINEKIFRALQYGSALSQFVPGGFEKTRSFREMAKDAADISAEQAKSGLDGSQNFGLPSLDKFDKFFDESIRRIRAKVGENANAQIIAADAAAGAAFKAKHAAGGGMPQAEVSGPVMNGAFSQALNMIMGRSANELILEESRKANALSERIATASEAIARNTAVKQAPAKAQQPRPAVFD